MPTFQQIVDYLAHKNTCLDDLDKMSGVRNGAGRVSGAMKYCDLLIPIAMLLTTSCSMMPARTKRLYSGPPRSNVAVLYASRHSNVIVHKVDGKKVGLWVGIHGRIEMLPGRHTLLVSYSQLSHEYGGGAHHFTEPSEVSFEAQSETEYALRVFKGRTRVNFKLFGRPIAPFVRLYPMTYGVARRHADILRSGTATSIRRPSTSWKTWGKAAKCNDGRCNGYDAIAYCGGRLPTVAQLKSMYQAECTGGRKSDTCNKVYWSSEESSSSTARVVHFNNGRVYRYSKSNASVSVRCAR